MEESQLYIIKYLFGILAVPILFKSEWVFYAYIVFIIIHCIFFCILGFSMRKLNANYHLYCMQHHTKKYAESYKTNVFRGFFIRKVLYFKYLKIYICG